MINKEKLNEVFQYNVDGSFTVKIKIGYRVVGQILSGSIDSYGYARLRVSGKQYIFHRLVWIYHHGDIPKTHQIDHINGIKHDNRIENLRLATIAENAQNVNKRTDNSSGCIGVSWYKPLQKWRVQIQVHKRKLHLGYFNTKIEASDTYLKFKSEFHKFQPTPRQINN